MPPRGMTLAGASWTGAPLRFPRIQGADCCGHIVAVGEGVARSRIGERVIVAPLLRHYRGYRPFEADTLGSEIDGAFAQYTRAPSRETHRVRCGWSSVELASMPCAYSTAENMLQRAGLGSERVLVTGASGGSWQCRGAACQAPRSARDSPGEHIEEGGREGTRGRRGD